MGRKVSLKTGCKDFANGADRRTEGKRGSGMLWSMNLIKAVGFAPVLLMFSFTAAQEVPQKNLTIENIFAEGGISGRAPEFVQWSPDSRKLSFIQRNNAGELGELWYADPATGEKKLLVSEARMSGLAPPIAAIKTT